MSELVTTLAALASHWRRHPSQLGTVLVGLAVATALWSGVQAINTHARGSYDRAVAVFGARAPSLLATSGDTFSQDRFVELRRSGWKVSPVVEAAVRIGGRRYTVLGIEPITLPADAALSGVAGGADDLERFLTPPWQTLASPETVDELAAAAGGATDVTTDKGQRLPPLAARDGLAPGTLVVDIGVAQRVLGLSGRVSRLLAPADLGANAAALAKAAGPDLRLVEASDEGDLERLTDSFHLNLTAFGLLSFVVGLFIVQAATGLAFEQRTGTFRTLRAMGVTARGLSTALLVELVGLALVAGVVGIVAGYAIAASLMPDVSASLEGLYGARVPGRLALDPGWWLSGLAMAVVGALAAAGTSLAKSLALPVLATGQAIAWREAQRRWLGRQAVVGAAGLALALVLWLTGKGLIAGFAMMAGLLVGSALLLPLALAVLLRIGERSARGPIAQWFWADGRQQLSGLSLALMALLLALAANIGVGTMVEGFRKTFSAWLERRLVSEVYFEARSNEDAGEIERWLAARPEVQAVLPIWKAETRLSGWPVDVYGSRDHATYRENWELLASVPNAWDRVRDGQGAMVSEQLARRLGVAPGGTLALLTGNGTWVVPVVGTYADYGNPRGQVRIDAAQLTARWPDVVRTNFAVRVAPAAAEKLIDDLGAAFGGKLARLVDQAYLKRLSRGIFERTFAVTAALNTLTLIVAGVALFTSLLTLSAIRLAQLAPVWAMGVTRRDLALLETGKIVLLALVTALIAVPVGLLLAWCLVAVVNVQAFGWRLPLHVFPLQWAALVALALVTALVAALVPMLRLARTAPSELIKVFASER